MHRSPLATVPSGHDGVAGADPADPAGDVGAPVGATSPGVAGTERGGGTVALRVLGVVESSPGSVVAINPATESAAAVAAMPKRTPGRRHQGRGGKGGGEDTAGSGLHPAVSPGAAWRYCVGASGSGA